MNDAAPALLRNPKDPLFKMLKKINQHEDDLENLDVEKVIGEIMLDSKDKVDGYFHLMEELDRLAAKSNARAQIHLDRADKYTSKRKEIQGKLINALARNNFDTFSGHEVRAKLSTSKTIAYNLSKPNDLHAIHHEKWVRTKFEWAGDALKKILTKVLPENATEEELQERKDAEAIAFIKTELKLKFDAVKEVD